MQDVRATLTTDRAWSKALFGNQNMLLVAHSIAEGEREFTSPELETRTELGPSSVHRLVQVLCSVGLVSRVDRGQGERVQMYRRMEQPFWAAVSRMWENAQSTPAVVTTLEEEG